MVLGLSGLGDEDLGANASGSSVTVRKWEQRNVEPVTSERGASEYEFRRIPPQFCGTLDATAVSAPCVDGAASGPVIRQCSDGSLALAPLFRRPVDPDTGASLGLWEPTSDVGGCPEDPPVAVVLTAEEFRRLPLTASTPTVQPGHGRSLIRMPLIVHTDPTPQDLTTTVLGTTVRVRATPSSFTWDFGDGAAPLSTTDPGAPYPHHTLTHTYDQVGTFPVTLTTTWTGQYQLPGGPWLPVTGTATTTSTPIPITTEEARARLVAQPLP